MECYLMHKHEQSAQDVMEKTHSTCESVLEQIQSLQMAQGEQGLGQVAADVIPPEIDLNQRFQMTQLLGDLAWNKK